LKYLNLVLSAIFIFDVCASSKVDEGDLASSALYHENKVYSYENNTDKLPVATETKSTKTKTRGRPKSQSEH
jgi:hypothetical protein